MTVPLANDLRSEAARRDERRAQGLDRFDEVWEGRYVMAPAPNNEHQDLVFELASLLREALRPRRRGRVMLAVNLALADDDWQRDYRVPDIAVFLAAGGGRDRDTHWLGPVDFVVEVASPHERSREKLEFYGRAEVRELLLVDRDPWALELYRGEQGRLQLEGRATAEGGETLIAASVGFEFRLVVAPGRPRLAVVRRETREEWLA